MDFFRRFTDRRPPRLQLPLSFATDAARMTEGDRVDDSGFGPEGNRALRRSGPADGDDHRAGCLRLRRPHPSIAAVPAWLLHGIRGGAGKAADAGAMGDLPS